MRWLLVAVFFCGCYAQPPPPALGVELTGCRAGAFGGLSSYECRSDAECVLCGCERVDSRRHLALTNAACPPRPTCEAEARCCLGRCVLTLGPPPL